MLRDGRVVVSDGPFTEAKEWISGIDFLEVRDLDEASRGGRRSSSHGASRADGTEPGVAVRRGRQPRRARGA